MKDLIVSIGNPFMGDDGIGQAILDELMRRGATADLMDLGTDIMRLSLYGKGYRRIVILDSLRGAGTPGEVLSFSEGEMVRDLDSRIRSAHLMGSIEAIQVLKIASPDLSRTEFNLVGIVAKRIETGKSLSPEVASSIKTAADRVESILRR